MTGAPIIVILVTIATYVGTGGVLNPVKLFTVLVLLELLRFPMMMLPSESPTSAAITYFVHVTGVPLGRFPSAPMADCERWAPLQWCWCKL